METTTGGACVEDARRGWEDGRWSAEIPSPVGRVVVVWYDLMSATFAAYVSDERGDILWEVGEEAERPDGPLVPQSVSELRAALSSYGDDLIPLGSLADAMDASLVAALVSVSEARPLKRRTAPQAR